MKVWGLAACRDTLAHTHLPLSLSLSLTSTSKPQIIEYAFASLASTHPTARFVSPAAAFLARAGGAAAVVGPLGLASAAVVLLPVNDNEDVERAGGGTHWWVERRGGRGA